MTDKNEKSIDELHNILYYKDLELSKKELNKETDYSTAGVEEARNMVEIAETIVRKIPKNCNNQHLNNLKSFARYVVAHVVANYPNSRIFSERYYRSTQDGITKANLLLGISYATTGKESGIMPSLHENLIKKISKIMYIKNCGVDPEEVQKQQTTPTTVKQNLETEQNMQPTNIEEPLHVKITPVPLKTMRQQLYNQLSNFNSTTMSVNKQFFPQQKTQEKV